MSEKLKPCPFCGKPAELIIGTNGDCRIRCTNTICGCYLEYLQENYVIKAWNRRAK